MNWKVLSPKLLVISGIILFAALMRLVPHYPNFTPVAAIALFGGAHYGKRWLAFFIPLFAMFMSDLVLGFHGLMIAVYFSFALVVGIGALLRNRVRVGTVMGATIGGSLLFFLVTNFAVWAGSPFYAQNAGGLISCYVAALPFFHSSLLGDMFYSGVFFGGYYLIEQRYPVLRKA
jgi:hypothetical protein